MTTVEIKYSLTSANCKIFIDAERVSNFSDLSSCEGCPLHLCAAKMIRLLDEEIGDDYILRITGFTFQIKLLTALADKSRYCTAVVGADLEASMSVNAVQKFFVSLAQRYSISSAKQDLNIRVAGSAAANAGALPYILIDAHEPELLLEYPQFSYSQDCRMVAVLSNDYDIRYKGKTCILSFPEDQMNSFCEYYYAVCKLLPFVEEITNACRYLSISAEDKSALTYVTTQIPQYYFSLEKNCLEVGETTAFSFKSFPKGAFTLRCDKQGMLSFASYSVSCTAGGIVKLFVCDQSGKVELEQAIECIKHNYITSIRLQASKTVLKENEHIMINALTLPERAEDEGCLEWSVSDYSIAHITSNGEVIALKPGRFTVFVKGREASCSMEMKVTSEIESISIRASHNAVELGKKAELCCTVYPHDAHVKGLIWSLENDEMGKLTRLQDDYHYEFTATTNHLGTAKIVCRPRGSDSDVRGSCEIEVQVDSRPSGFIACTLVFTILGLLMSFLIPTLWAIGGGITGFFADFFLPASFVMSIIGVLKYPGIKTFRTCLILDIIFTAVMLLISLGGG